MGRTLRDDFRQGGHFRKIRREWRELKDFYLDAERRKQLREMGWFRRFFKSAVWLFKSLFFRLTPIRRILFVLAFVLFLFFGELDISGRVIQLNPNNILLSAIIIFFLLMLELKDKLLAHSELQSGRAIQNALTPEQQPEIPGWDVFLYSRPAKDVGGDLVDYFSFSKDNYDFVLGDVAGKGLPAALFMARIQAVLRALAPDFVKTEKLIGKVNSIFYRDGLRRSFVSLIYLRLNTGPGKIEMVNAGHMPPFLYADSELSQLSKGGLAVGLKEDAVYSSKEIIFNPGDLLFIYSDGLSEARNEENIFFGEKQIEDILLQSVNNSVYHTAKEIIERTEAFVGDSSYSDDLSFMIIKKKQPGALG